jgi:hypothetical protein
VLAPHVPPRVRIVARASPAGQGPEAECELISARTLSTRFRSNTVAYSRSLFCVRTVVEHGEAASPNKGGSKLSKLPHSRAPEANSGSKRPPAIPHIGGVLRYSREPLKGGGINGTDQLPYPAPGGHGFSSRRDRQEKP